MDQEERAGIRSAYRNLLADTNSHKDEFLSRDIGKNKLQETLDQANKIFGQVKMPREAVMDSQLLTVLAGFGVQHAQALKTDFVCFEPTEFAKGVMDHLEVPRLQDSIEPTVIPVEGWAQLGKMAMPAFKRAPVLTYMFGAFERGPPKKKPAAERTRIEKEAISKTVVTPKQIMNIEGSRSEATTEEVERIFTTLRQYYLKWDQNPICYFEFVINPTSFGQTIENIFYTSFLVRDGHVRIFLDDDALPVIEPIMDLEEETTNAAAEGERNQVVIALTMAEWKEIINAFDITKPLIMTRRSNKP